MNLIHVTPSCWTIYCRRHGVEDMDQSSSYWLAESMTRRGLTTADAVEKFVAERRNLHLIYDDAVAANELAVDFGDLSAPVVAGRSLDLSGERTAEDGEDLEQQADSLFGAT